MAQTFSTMLELGTPVPPFNLADLNGQFVSNDQFKNKPLLVMFICHHCPHVKHVMPTLSDFV